MVDSVTRLHPPSSPFFGLAQLDDLQPRAEEVVRKITQGTALEEVARAFLMTVRGVRDLLDAPLTFVQVGYMEAGRHIILEDVARPRGFRPGDEVTRDVLEEGHKKFEQRAHEMGIQIPTMCASALAQVTTLGFATSEVQTLFRAAIAQAWTGFECLAVDLWVAALNADTRLGHQALSADPPNDVPVGLAQKSLPLATLGRYQFDVSRCLGTVLKDKFRFGKVEGIRTAYTAAFGEKTPCVAALGHPGLPKLEATRHLIVHRAGRIDEGYARATGSKEPLGSVIHLDGKVVADLICPALDVGYGLLDYATGLACARAPALVEGKP
jgi:hypothetical protein